MSLDDDLWDENEDNDFQFHYIEELDHEKSMRLSKKIGHLNDNELIKKVALKSLLVDNFKILVSEYQKKENLPRQYVEIAQRSNAISILLKNFFINIAQIDLTDKLSQKINTLEKKLYKNKSQKIVYDRVTKIQEFIHRTLEKETFLFGPPDVADFRHILSAARLHLSLVDYGNKDAQYNRILYFESLRRAEDTQQEKEPTHIPLGKRAIKNWRVRHLKPIVFTIPKSQLKRYYAILTADTSMNTYKFQEHILKLYSSCNPPTSDPYDILETDELEESCCFSDYWPGSSDGSDVPF